MEDIIVPGEKVSDSVNFSSGTYVDGGSTYASVVSLFRDGKSIALKGYYLPTAGDFVIGVVTEERFSGFVIDIHCPYPATLSNRESREQFSVGDVVSVQIASVNEVHEAELVEPRKLTGGKLVDLSFVKVPRIIGRNGSMLELIKNSTGTDVLVGKNGRIYLSSGNTNLATLALMKIDSESHKSGLTDRISEFLSLNIDK